MQTVLYAPHFISTMVICGMIKIFLSPSGGLLNLILGTSVDFLSESTAFRTIYVASGIWQEAGWGTIIYMAWLLWPPACTKPLRSMARPCSSAFCTSTSRNWYP